MTEADITTALTLDETGERADLLETLQQARAFLRFTVRDLTDDQARLTPTASELSLGGLIKHVASTEEGWARFVTEGPEALGGDMEADVDYSSMPPEVLEQFANGFKLTSDETLAGVLEYYADVAARTDELIRTVDLDNTFPLPRAPWFAEGATRSARRTFTHIAAETFQHAGHADIIRETIDGQKTQG